MVSSAPSRNNCKGPYLSPECINSIQREGCCESLEDWSRNADGTLTSLPVKPSEMSHTVDRARRCRVSKWRREC
ncbi:hypothetical protein AGIG_G7034 [Arapaima gigas]